MLSGGLDAEKKPFERGWIKFYNARRNVIINLDEVPTEGKSDEDCLQALFTLLRSRLHVMGDSFVLQVEEYSGSGTNNMTTLRDVNSTAEWLAVMNKWKDGRAAQEDAFVNKCLLEAVQMCNTNEPKERYKGCTWLWEMAALHDTSVFLFNDDAFDALGNALQAKDADVLYAATGALWCLATRPELRGKCVRFVPTLVSRNTI